VSFPIVVSEFGSTLSQVFIRKESGPMKNLFEMAIVSSLAVLACISCAQKQNKPSQDQVERFAAAPIEAQPLDLKMAHFALNSSEITDIGKAALKHDLEELEERPNVKVQVQGFCDDRGSVAYNLNLGERRAKAVSKYLESQGISGDRISIVSYGKARPLDPRDNEAAWALNRRASFLVQDNSQSSL
jgi:outer membrane protein OmpA-like peptidoglycan-associated protein